MIRAVEMLNTLVVWHAQLLFTCLNIVEVNLTKQWIPFYNFIEHINVEWESFRCLQVLDKFTTDRAAHSEVPEKRCRETLSAEGVTTVHENARNPRTNIVLLSTEMAGIKTPRLVVCFNHNWLFSNQTFWCLPFIIELGIIFLCSG